MPTQLKQQMPQGARKQNGTKGCKHKIGPSFSAHGLYTDKQHAAEGRDRADVNPINSV